LHAWVDGRHHAVDGEHGPPGSSPAFFELWVTASIHQSELHAVEPNLESQCLGGYEDLSCTWNLVVCVQANGEKHQSLD
jgi:hypothetical protein